MKTAGDASAVASPAVMNSVGRPPVLLPGKAGDESKKIARIPRVNWPISFTTFLLIENLPWKPNVMMPAVPL